MAVDKLAIRPADIRGASRLAIDATLGVIALVETMHHNILRVPGILGTAKQAPTKGITGLVYRSIRGVTRLVGGSIDLALGQLIPLLGPSTSSTPSPAREAIVAALNGVLGDHLAATSNPLAISMQFRKDGEMLVLSREALTRSLLRPSNRIVLFVHGLCMNDLQWYREGHDHGAHLETYLSPNVTTIYLHYNSGLHISTNGQDLADKLEALIAAWPVAVEQLDIVGHSMGGLVARSACFYAKESGRHWLSLLRKMVFLGTPHAGAPLERGGNYVNLVLDASPYTTAFARLAKIRSAGITDLRYGSLRDEDWATKDRFARKRIKLHAVPLPDGVKCYAIAATTADKGNVDANPRKKLAGDRLVPVASAFGQSADPERCLAIPKSRQWLGYNMNHMELLNRKDAYERLSKWLADR